MSIAPKIALIHATPLAMAPVAEAFAQLWPEAVCMNLLDDRLSADMAQIGALTAGLTGRIVGLARHAKDWGADAILYTCSAFGPAIDAAERHVELPTYKPNDAMFLEALGYPGLQRPARIGLISTFAPSVYSMRDELLAAARDRRLDLTCQTQCVSGALEALRAGDGARHDQLIAEAAQGVADCDVVMLGQFSMARAQAIVARAIGKPVLTSPHSAVRLLQGRLAPHAPLVPASPIHQPEI